MKLPLSLCINALTFVANSNEQNETAPFKKKDEASQVPALGKLYPLATWIRYLINFAMVPGHRNWP